MKILIIIAAITCFQTGRMAAQSVYTTNKGHISFFADAPVADVDAQNDRAQVTLNTSTGELIAEVDMPGFVFKNKKMGRDARGNYIEIDKFPKARFSGKIAGNVHYDKPGSYPVTATGKLKIHGTEREVNEKGTVDVRKGHIGIASQFTVMLKDYNIETPKILGQEMTAEKVVVNIKASLSPKSKK